MKHKALFKNKVFSPYSKVRNSKLYNTARQICSILKKNQYEAYLVGGAVRDLLLKPNAIPKDLDIATSASPEEICRIFQNSKFVGEAFGVCLVTLNNLSFEVTSYRKEGKYLDKRRPESISKGTFEDDSKRRDFTINCLYFDPIKNEIRDPQKGFTDLKNKIIRCVGQAEDRLNEDALRILRMARFAANLNFNIEKESLSAAKKYAEGIHQLSKERILLEFQKIKLGRFYYFAEYLNSILDLNEMLSDKIKMKHITDDSILHNKHYVSKIKIDTQYPFFNFLKYFLFKHTIDLNKTDNFEKTLEKWPLCTEDKKICTIFMNCIKLKNNMSKNIEVELLDFIFFEQLQTINSITKNIPYGVLINLSLFIKDSLLIETLYKYIDIYSKKITFQVNTKEIIKEVEKNNLDKKYISAISKYLHYINFKKGIVPEIDTIIQFKKTFFIDYFKIGSI
ncbi:CCA tRNA nucleotidyltransferase [Silvanigrella aquatica]|uniref:Poly A polymerase head domain-containing protein n=1 Tax=Silvanigrella aquatica TaxID=1915309 RepID=A0A1L4D3R1_9BACT|nr:CCA tRNA nucleotidyltransferase [Silvanigrella aquatica]APJ04812.1 hypothetical protein AXG55_13255 [Silvanigrella aquatica]